MTEYDRLKKQWDAMLARKLSPVICAADHLELLAQLAEQCGRPEGPGNANIHRKHAAALRAFVSESQ